MSTQPEVEIVSVERIDGTKVVVEFSDSTYAVLTTRQLREAATNRRPLEVKERSSDLIQ